jgi:hypothetical protein
VVGSGAASADLAGKGLQDLIFAPAGYFAAMEGGAESDAGGGPGGLSALVGQELRSFAPPHAITSDPESQRFEAIALDADGSLFAAWLDAAAQEAGISRIYGGIHFSFSVDAGFTVGQEVGDWTLQAFNLSQDTTPPKIVVNQASGLVTNKDPTVTGEEV